jgi:hypothetical protein
MVAEDVAGARWRTGGLADWVSYENLVGILVMGF